MTDSRVPRVPEVRVANEEPIAVVIDPEGVTPLAITEPQQVARTAAIESDRVSYGQRRINLVWELTQAIIALSVTGTLLGVAAVLIIRGDAMLGTAFLLLSNLGNLVIGFYFGRTNHQRTGGVGGNQVDGR